MERLRALRKKHNWKQKEVADMLGIHVTTYTKYETGKSSPNRDMLIKLAEVFGVSIDYLLEVTSNANKKEMPPTAIDEGQLDAEIIGRLVSLTPEELGKVDAFVQGMIASRSKEASPPT